MRPGGASIPRMTYLNELVSSRELLANLTAREVKASTGAPSSGSSGR